MDQRDWGRPEAEDPTLSSSPSESSGAPEELCSQATGQRKEVIAEHFIVAGWLEIII